ncbi:MAG: hypothetical protein KJ063_05985 [Anaerolineae bacterium]|nr:hypothetical protein [Anaerolineae bacterium]
MSTGQPPFSWKSILQDRRSLGVIIGIMAAVGGLLLLCLFAFLILSPSGDGPATVITPTTPFSGLGPVESNQNVGIITSDGLTLTLDAPITLEIAGQTFTVQSQIIPATGEWIPPALAANAAVWIQGTVVNYVFGLPDSVENRALFDQLATGDDLVLTTRANSNLQFAFNSREVVAANNRDIFAQHQPGITLVLMGTQGDRRLVVRGRHTVSEANTSGTGSLPSSFALGETAPLGNLQVTVTGATHLLNRPEAPAGFAFYLIEYQVQNLATINFDSTLLRSTLTDSLGNQYAVHTTASAFGSNPALFGVISPNQLVPATVGYQIPLELSGPFLRWRLTRSDNNAYVEIEIPFADQSVTAQSAQIALLTADVSLDGTNVLLSGQITNLGQQALIINEKDLVLQGDEGSFYLLLSTNPGFPWVISPGASIAYQVMFQRPAGSQAIFILLNQPFQLNGLR